MRQCLDPRIAHHRETVSELRKRKSEAVSRARSCGIRAGRGAVATLERGDILSASTADPQTIACPTWCVKSHEEEHSVFLNENPLHSSEKVDIWPEEENSAYGEIDLLTQRDGEALEGESIHVSLNIQEAFTSKKCRELPAYLLVMADRMDAFGV